MNFGNFLGFCFVIAVAPFVLAEPMYNPYQEGGESKGYSALIFDTEAKGSFDQLNNFSKSKPNDRGELLLSTFFNIKTLSKGSFAPKRIGIKTLAVFRCVSPDSLLSFKHSFELAKKDMNKQREILNGLNSDDKNGATVCFYAVPIVISYWDKVYRSNYELIFEGRNYFIYFNSSKKSNKATFDLNEFDLKMVED